MNKNKKRKMSIIVIAIITVAMVASVFLSQIGSLRKSQKSKTDAETTAQQQSKNGSSSSKKTTTDPNKEFRVLWAFADIDSDFMIQVKDDSDSDKKADYVFVKFTNEILDNTSKNGALNVANYKLDGKALPKGSSIIPDIKGYDAEQLKRKITIKLPNGYLKGVNAPHTLELSKEIHSKYNKPITGDLKITLSYSKAEVSSSQNKSGNSTANKNNGQGKNSNQNKGMPAYKLEIGKSIPYTTLVVAYLDTKTPEKYKVSVEGKTLPLKAKKSGEKVFIDVLEKDYTEDQVKSLIKIEKIK